MIHIGEQKFYDEVAQDLQAMNQILVEGVPLPKRGQLGSYTVLAKAIGLETQSQCLRIPSDVGVTNIDLSPQLFRLEYLKLPIRDKLKLLFIERFLRRMPKKYRSRLKDWLIRVFAYKGDQGIELINPLRNYAFKHQSKTKLDLLLENQRDEAIAANLKKYIEDNYDRKYRMDIAILFGDAHMPYIYEQLHGQGFRWHMEKKVIVF